MYMYNKFYRLISSHSDILFSMKYRVRSVFLFIQKSKVIFYIVKKLGAKVGIFQLGDLKFILVSRQFLAGKSV